MQLIRATLALALVTCAASAAVFACDSTSADPGGSSGGGGGGNDDAQPSNADGGGPGPGADGGGGGGGDGGGPNGTATALIEITQLVTTTVTELGIGAQFGASSAGAAGCTITPVGACVATRCPNVMGSLPSSLNAGAITLTGTGPGSPATLTFGPEGDSGMNGYSHVQAQTRFYNDGDTLSVSGAGGPDLAAFGPQTIIAPNDIVLTSPACADVVCPDFARSADATVTWTGGGAGKVLVTFITTTDAHTSSLSCNFDATAGTGTVPTAALMLLDPGSASGFYGVEFLSPINTNKFTVGTTLVSFRVQGSPTEGSFTTTD